jgi:purine nucleosidase
VPVDLTERCVMGRAALHRLAKEPRARFARDICGVYFEYHHAGFGEWACFLHDPIAVAAAAWPELFPTVALSVDVETEGRLTRGMTVADFRPPAYSPRVEPNARVCLEAGCEAIVGRILRRFGTGGAA